MMHSLKQRVQVTLMATVVAAACGALAGYCAGREIVLRLAEARLREYAARLVDAGEASTAEAHTLLAMLNASPYSYCSDAEIAHFRNLNFQAQYLSDAGRMRDGKIDCSASMGRLLQPLALPKPDYTTQDGTRVYVNLTPPHTDNVRRLGLQQGESYVVLSSHILAHLGTNAAQYSFTVIDSSGRPVGRLANAWPRTDLSILVREGQTRVRESLYATRCFANHFTCVTAYAPISEALQAGGPQLTGFTVLGGLIGACFGFAFSLLYRRSRNIEQQLRRAIARDKLRVVYQPIVTLPGQRIVGAEALVRWTDEEGLMVGPDIFVRIAEERGFVGSITELVVRHALRDFGKLLRSHPDFRLSINVAAADLADPGFLPMLEGSMKRVKVAARSLAIEITERCTANQQVAKEAIHGLRRRDHCVQIDDFGTGYSSLSYLHELSVDAIKIDRSFTAAIGTEAVTVSILPQILVMAEALNLGVIAEGIETELQADYFAACNLPILGQGWLFGHSVPAAEFLRILAEDEKKATVSASVD
jgi:sensor c-di-GMP phosphodiesterase-like protein